MERGGGAKRGELLLGLPLPSGEVFYNLLLTDTDLRKPLENLIHVREKERGGATACRRRHREGKKEKNFSE